MRYDHPGYFLVAAGLVITHALLIVDSLLPHRHDGLIWSIVAYAVPVEVTAVVHLGICVAIIYGMYRRFWVARFGFLVSCALFNVIGTAMLLAAILHVSVSFYGAVSSVSLSMSSYAAYREPSFNPTFARPRPKR